MFQRFSIGLAGAAVLAALSAGPAQAGMKVLTHFANLSPYTAKIEFPRGMQDCWNDLGAEYDRHSWWDRQTKGMDLHAYEESFRMDYVHPKGHGAYLKYFKDVYGISDIADLKTLSMNNTSISLPAGRTGEKVEMALFRGEAAAGVSVLGVCKFKKSSRGFVITLLDAQNQVMSRNHYEIRNPPDGAWTLSRWSPEDPEVGELITLGTGGQGRPLEIGITTVAVVATVASAGMMRAEVMKACAFMPSTSIARAQAAKWGVPWDPRFTKEAAMRGFALMGRWTSKGPTMVRWYKTMPIQLLLTGVFDGALYYSRPDPAVPEGNELIAVSVEELLQTAADPDFEYEESVLTLASGLPEKAGDRSICLIEGDIYQLGVRICDVVGITLEILPNGSVVVSPLPSVGDGTHHIGFF